MGGPDKGNPWVRTAFPSIAFDNQTICVDPNDG